MNFSDNLHYLRKRDKVTQEDLADRLCVSRQSVSKWETGEAYPETDKLIALSDIFNVSLDDLLRKDLMAHTKQQETVVEEIAPQDNCTQSDYVAHMNKVSAFMALGVFSILLGAGICVMLAGIGELMANKENLLGIFGAVAVILFCAVSVFLFVFAGIRHDHFRREHARISFDISEAQRRTFEKRFAFALASLISSVLLDVVFLVIMAALIDEKVIATNISPDAVYCFVVAAFLLVLAFLFGGIVYCAIQRKKYNIEEYNRETQSKTNPTRAQKISDGICSAIMLTAAAIFLFIGFVWNKWHPSWIVFPIGGILCAIVSTIFEARK